MTAAPNTSIFHHMRPQDVDTFKLAARFHGVFILVRRTNPQSLPYIARRGFVPKRLDCKAKTASSNFRPPGQPPKDVAGLVVDPTLTGPEAFRQSDGASGGDHGGGKYAKAQKEWAKFASAQLAPELSDLDAQKRLTYIPHGKVYFVQRDPEHEHYGCVMHSATSLITAACCIHGDYDLYAIVPNDDRSTNIAVLEERLGQVHTRGKKFFDVQNFLNGRIGVPMVLHGSQEKYASSHDDEPVDMFHPDGETVELVPDSTSLEALYRDRFEGRKLFNKPGAGDSHFGMYRRA